jgi:hypothetical protein
MKLQDSIFKQVVDAGEIRVSETAKNFNITPKSVHKKITDMIADKKIKRTGKGKYELIEKSFKFEYETKNLNEDRVLINDILPNLPDMNARASKNFSYVFSEMLNNAIDHSNGAKARIFLAVSEYAVNVVIADDGIGIFENIKRGLKLEEKRYAVLELAKGKFTTAPNSHSGEGIFFSSKVADKFYIASDNLTFYSGASDTRQYPYETDKTAVSGTSVFFSILCGTGQDLNKIFETFTEMPDDFGFTKTSVPVKLLGYGENNPFFVSRSQAKRLLQGFERFQDITLDFAGIDEIGQAFADEIFRVFISSHPITAIEPVNCSQQVGRMIRRARENLLINDK